MQDVARSKTNTNRNGTAHEDRVLFAICPSTRPSSSATRSRTGVIAFTCVRIVYEVSRVGAGCYSLRFSIHLAARFAVIREIVFHFVVFVNHSSWCGQRHSHHGICFQNRSFPHGRVQTRDHSPGIRPGSGTAEEAAHSQLTDVHHRLGHRLPGNSCSSERLPGSSRPRHHEAFSPLVTSRDTSPCSWESLVEQVSTSRRTVTTVKMLRRRRHAGAWFQLLRSYMGQCDAVNGDDHHRRVEGDEVESRRRKSRGVGVKSWVSAAARTDGGRIRAGPADGDGIACAGG